MVTKASPLQPEREKEARNNRGMALNCQTSGLFVLLAIFKIAVMLKCFRML